MSVSVSFFCYVLSVSVSNKKLSVVRSCVLWKIRSLVKQQNGEGTKPEILFIFFGPVRNNCWLFLWNWQGEKLN